MERDFGAHYFCFASLLFLRVSAPLEVALSCFCWSLGMAIVPRCRTSFFDVYLLLRLSWLVFLYLLALEMVAALSLLRFP